MAVIYVPQDPREAAWGQILSDAFDAWAPWGPKQKTKAKVQAIQDAIQSGQRDPLALEAMAGDNPQAQKVVQNLLAAMTEQRQEKALDETIKRDDASIENMHSEQALRQFTMQKETALLPLQIANMQSEANLRRAEAAKIPAEIAHYQMEDAIAKQNLLQQR